jgi:hypothetical protein
MSGHGACRRRRPAGRLPDDPAASAGCRLDAADEDPSVRRPTERRSDGRRGRRDGDAEVRALVRLTATQRVDPCLEGLVGGERQVEALANAVRAQADERALGVEERAPGRSGSERRGVLERARDPAPAGSPERPLD